MAKKGNKTSIDLVTVDLSEDKIKELKEFNGKLQQIVSQTWTNPHQKKRTT